MYNRYIPSSNGVYERRTVEEPEKRDPPCTAPDLPERLCEQTACPKQERPPQTGGPLHMDLGDLLLLCIILLILMESEDGDRSTLLITAAAFLLLQ